MISAFLFQATATGFGPKVGSTSLTVFFQVGLEPSNKLSFVSLGFQTSGITLLPQFSKLRQKIYIKISFFVGVISIETESHKQELLFDSNSAAKDGTWPRLSFHRCIWDTERNKNIIFPIKRKSVLLRKIGSLSNCKEINQTEMICFG